MNSACRGLFQNRSRADGRLPELRCRYYLISTVDQTGSAWGMVSFSGDRGSLLEKKMELGLGDRNE